MSLPAPCSQSEAEVSQWGPATAEGRTDFETAGAPMSLEDVRLLPPITSTSTIVGVGMNYWSHLEKLGVTERPSSTLGFLKPQVGSSATTTRSPILSSPTNSTSKLSWCGARTADQGGQQQPD